MHGGNQSYGSLRCKRLFVGIGPGGQALVMETNGERSSAPSPIDLLLIAVGGCMGSDVVDILKKKRERITDYRIEVHGERRQEFPRSYKNIRIHHVVKGPNLSEGSVKQAVELSNSKYCSVAATLRPTAEISVTFDVVPDRES
ncbi:MAG: OsmC family protein [Candidatus Acidiferrales bacterium]